MMSKISVIIKGAIGNFNFGDDLLTFSMCTYLQKKNVPFEITVISNEEYLLKHINNIKITKEYGVTGNFDWLIYAGGTQFASFSEVSRMSIPLLLRSIIINLRAPHLIYKKVKNKFFGAALFTYKRLALLGVGIGPFYKENKYFEDTLKTIRTSNFLSVRDKLSEEICINNKIEYVKGSDLVYSLPDSYWYNFKNESKNINSIAIIVRDWEFADEEAAFIYYIKDLKYKNCPIHFFSFCRDKDSKCIKYLTEEGYGDSISVWDPENDSFEYYLGILAQYDLFITSRYHGAIIASLLNRPFISIGIEPKLTMAADLFQMPSWNYPYKLKECEDYLKEIDEDYIGYLERIPLQVKIEQLKNDEMMRSFFDLNIYNHQ